MLTGMQDTLTCLRNKVGENLTRGRGRPGALGIADRLGCLWLVRPAMVEHLRAGVPMGWFISAGAVSFGAPFWLHTLNKFIVVRSTIKPREKSHEQHSKNCTQRFWASQLRILADRFERR